MPPTHVLVKASPGRVVPIPASDGSGENGQQLRATPDKVIRVAYSQFTRKYTNNGDMFFCDLNGAPVDSADLAAAPMDIAAMREAAEVKSKRGEKMARVEMPKGGDS